MAARFRWVVMRSEYEKGAWLPKTALATFLDEKDAIEWAESRVPSMPSEKFEVVEL